MSAWDPTFQLFRVAFCLFRSSFPSFPCPSIGIKPPQLYPCPLHRAQGTSIMSEDSLVCPVPFSSSLRIEFYFRVLKSVSSCVTQFRDVPNPLQATLGHRTLLCPCVLPAGVVQTMPIYVCPPFHLLPLSIRVVVPFNAQWSSTLRLSSDTVTPPCPSNSACLPPGHPPPPPSPCSPGTPLFPPAYSLLSPGQL